MRGRLWFGETASGDIGREQDPKSRLKSPRPTDMKARRDIQAYGKLNQKRGNFFYSR